MQHSRPEDPHAIARERRFELLEPLVLEFHLEGVEDGVLEDGVGGDDGGAGGGGGLGVGGGGGGLGAVCVSVSVGVSVRGVPVEGRSRLYDGDGAPAASRAGELRPADARVVDEFADAFEAGVGDAQGDEQAVVDGDEVAEVL